MTDGLIRVDKPGGITSHGAVARTRKALNTKKVGHAGTLDPMATGLLILGVGRATRLLTYIVGADKEYLATIRLGVGTVTDDADGDVTSTPGFTTPELVPDGLTRLTGPIMQAPSAVSAIKVNGVRSYARVRAGEDVDLPARPVTIHALKALDMRPGIVDGVPVLDVDVRASVSSGTYIRALARDLGTNLNSAGHLTALRRTQVGPFDVDGAWNLEDQPEIMSMADAARRLFPVANLSSQEATLLSHGSTLPALEGTGIHAAIRDDQLLGLIENEGDGARPRLVIPHG